jgi:hypothetical protein
VTWAYTITGFHYTRLEAATGTGHPTKDDARRAALRSLPAAVAYDKARRAHYGEDVAA